MGLFRIIFSLCLIKEIETTRTKSIFAVEGGFHLPYVPFIQPVPREVFDWMMTLQYPLAMLLLVGLWMRPACVALIGLQGYIFFTDQLNFRNHPYFFILVLIALLLSHADQSFSFKSYIRQRFEGQNWREALCGPLRPVTMQRLIQVQLTCVYLFAAYHKLHPHYLDGSVMLNQVHRDLDIITEALHLFLSPERVTAVVDRIQQPGFLEWPARFSVFLELFIPLALWNRFTRPLAILLGLGFHGSIALFMNIKAFSFATMGVYLLWCDVARWTGIFRSKCVSISPARQSEHASETPETSN